MSAFEHLWFNRCGNNPKSLSSLLKCEYGIDKTVRQVTSFRQKWILRKLLLGQAVGFDCSRLDSGAKFNPIHAPPKYVQKFGREMANCLTRIYGGDPNNPDLSSTDSMLSCRDEDYWDDYYQFPLDVIPVSELFQGDVQTEFFLN